MVGAEDWDLDELFALVRRRLPLPQPEPRRRFRGVVEMLAGKYPEQRLAPAAGPLSWDRVNNRLAALPGSRLLATGSGGTIPDRGAFSWSCPTGAPGRRARRGVRLRDRAAGDTFLLGSQVWRATEITDDRVVAEPAPGEMPRMPFWRGDAPWRPYDLGRRIGEFRRRVADAAGPALGPAELSRLAASARRPSCDGAGETAAARRRAAALPGRECALDRNSILQSWSPTSPGSVAAAGASPPTAR